MTAGNDKPDRDEGAATEGFLSRWSRVKRGAGSTTPAAAQKSAVEPATGDSADEEPQIDLAQLPSIDDLLPTSDVSAFLRRGVPDELKRLALQKAWSLDPAIRDFIEVAENQYNWNAPDGVPGFGALDPGVDIEALLAQATGQLRDVVPPPADAITLLPQTIETGASAVGMAPVSAPSGCGSEDVSTTAETPAPSPHSPAVQAAPDASAAFADHAAPQQNGRRHGGALPRTV